MDLKKDRPGFRPIRHGRADGYNEGLIRSLRVNGGNGRDTRSLCTPANPTSTDSSACAIGFFAHESIFHHARSSGVPRLGRHEDTAATDAAYLEDRPNNHDGVGGADSRDRGSSRPRDKLNASRLQTAWSDATHTLDHLASRRYAGAFPPFTTRPFRPELTLKNPVFVISEPGTRDLLVVLQGGEAERPSRIVRIAEVPKDGGPAGPEPLLEIPGRLVYSVAFHPGHAINGQMLVFSNGRTGQTERTNRLSRFRIGRDGSRTLVPGSEEILLEWRSGGHDGGGMGFGPDGMLYVSTGDGSNDSDAWDSGQTLDDLLGGVLRIDLDHPDPGLKYGVPKDNPFVGISGARGELWAYGLRNPWRLAVDPPSGQVWVGNNGQDLWESAHLIRRGENYGWSVYEGSHLFYRNRRRGPTPVTAPTFEHHHSEARSLTGGVVYRGGQLPGLEGAYVYGDHSTGRIWAGLHDGTKVVWHREIAATPLLITSFGLSPSGRLLVTDLGSGLQEIVPAPPPATTPAFPASSARRASSPRPANTALRRALCPIRSTHPPGPTARRPSGSWPSPETAASPMRPAAGGDFLTEPCWCRRCDSPRRGLPVVPVAGLRRG